MSRRLADVLTSWWILIGVLLLLSTCESPHAADNELRERLTEREDKRRPVEPWSIDVAGRPLMVSGEYEIDMDYLRRRFVGDTPAQIAQPDRLLLEQGLEAEAFYSFGLPLSLFAQLRIGMAEDLLPDTFEEISDFAVERGEMWLYSENITRNTSDANLNLDLGRLHFEDERRWWWDDDLDAIRVAYETGTSEIILALAQELGPSRSDHDHVDPEHEGVLRLIAEASWDWSRNHALQIFLLHQNDHSSAYSPGQAVSVERVDESDARLTWFGARLVGVLDLRAFKPVNAGILGYWLDTARVGGEEQLFEFEQLSPQQFLAATRTGRDVEGWAVDVGLNWMLPVAREPRLFAAYACGSGDPAPDDGTDQSFRQTGIHANEAGFGGVQRFPHYGVLLAPELSNLQVLTLGAGFSLLKASSLDIVYHHYRLAEPATSLRNARLETTLSGQHRNLGTGIDIVLAIEEWERLEFEFVASGFRAGRAFGEDRGQWSYEGFLAMRLAF